MRLRPRPEAEVRQAPPAPAPAAASLAGAGRLCPPGGRRAAVGSRQEPQVRFTALPADFKDNLNKVYEAIEESDFLAIDGEFSGTVAAVSCS